MSVMVHFQQRYLSPVEYLSTIIIPPAAAISRLETWSDSASEETYISYSPAGGFDKLQILQAPSPSNNQTLPSKIYARDPQRSVSQFLLSSTGSTHKIPSGVSLGFYYS